MFVVACILQQQQEHVCITKPFPRRSSRSEILPQEWQWCVPGPDVSCRPWKLEAVNQKRPQAWWNTSTASPSSVDEYSHLEYIEPLEWGWTRLAATPDAFGMGLGTE